MIHVQQRAWLLPAAPACPTGLVHVGAGIVTSGSSRGASDDRKGEVFLERGRARSSRPTRSAVGPVHQLARAGRPLRLRRSATRNPGVRACPRRPGRCRARWCRSLRRSPAGVQQLVMEAPDGPGRSPADAPRWRCPALEGVQLLEQRGGIQHHAIAEGATPSDSGSPRESAGG